MQVFHSIPDIRAYLSTQRHQGRSIGLVPTMGALHTGHLSLIEASRRDNQLTVCSIFVNPIQFNNPDDLARYPRTLEADCALLDTARCDAVFAPSAEEMYPEKPALTFDFGDLERVMEGKFRPGHFNGVGIVVAKLFNIIQPDRAYFGQKDLQQVAVVRRMMVDLGFPIELIVCLTLREPDGLAMSSRNRNLTPEERPVAGHIYKGLTVVREMLLSGKTPAEVRQKMESHFAEQPALRLEYVEVVNARTLQPVETIQPAGQTALCIAAHLGKVRLIDNVVF